MRKLKKGFTIVELVIVIGVIAILSAILIPTFVSLSGKAKTAKAQQEVADAYTLFVLDCEDGTLHNDPEDTAAEIAAPAAYAQGDVYVVHSEQGNFVYESGWKAPGTGSVTKGTTDFGEYNGCHIWNAVAA